MNYSPLHPSEANRVADILKAFCIETKTADGVYEFRLHSIASGETVACIAEDGDSIIGIGCFTISGESLIGNLVYVVPEHRGKTIGGKIHGVFRKYAETHGLRKLTIFATDEQAENYYKLGYTRTWNVLEMEV